MSNPLVYLACPYSHEDPHVREWRFRAVSRVAGELMGAGMILFSPISHSHPIALASAGLPTDWAYWKGFCETYLSLCHTMIVLRLDGWEESVGVTAEIKLAQELGLEIRYIDP